MPSKPTAQIAGWKRRSRGPHEWIFGARKATEYNVDADAVTAGVQNKIIIDNIPHDPADETIDVFILDVGPNGKFNEPAFVYSSYSVTLSGGITDSQTNVGVSALASANDFADGHFVEIDDGTNREYCEIISGGGTTSWTVARGIHGTDGTAFSSGATVRRVSFNVPHSAVVLDGDATPLGAPILALEAILNGFRLTITPPSDPNGLLVSYYLYVDTSSPASTLTTILPGTSTVTEYFLGPSDVKSLTYYFRAKSFTRWGVLSSGYSNEVSGQVLTQGDETPAVQPDAPTLAVVANGGGAQGFFFTVGVVFSSETGIGGVTKCQIQVALASATHSTSTGFSATVYDEDHPRPPTNAIIKVDLSSAQAGGQYQFSARVYNPQATGVESSLWSAPQTAATSVGEVDSAAPGAPRTFQMFDAFGADGGVGNTITGWIYEPDAPNANTIYGYQFRGSETLWSANLADTLELTTVETNGTGDISVGGQTMTNLSVSLGAADYTGYILFVYDSADTATGEVVHPFARVIASNTATTITLKTGQYFHKTAVGTNFAIGAAWNFYDHRGFGATLGPLKGGIRHIAGGSENELFQIDPFPFTKAAYWRARAESQIAWGPWRYHDGGNGTTTRLSATQFTPSQLQAPAVANNAITAPKQGRDTIPAGHDLAFVPFVGSENNRVSWSAGNIYFQDGASQVINSGSTATLTAGVTYWIYALVGDSASATLQVTSTVSATVGTDKARLAVVVATSDANETVSIQDIVSGADTILSAAIANFGKVSALSADLGSMTAGTVTGATIRTAASGARIQMTSTAFETYDASVKRLEIPTSADQINFYDGAGGSQGSIYGTTDGLTIEASPVVIKGPLLTGDPLLGVFIIGGTSGTSVNLAYGGNIKLSTATGGVNVSGALSVDGSADAVQLTVLGHTTQTSNIAEIKKSSGEILFRAVNAPSANNGHIICKAAATNTAALELDTQNAATSGLLSMKYDGTIGAAVVLTSASSLMIMSNRDLGNDALGPIFGVGRNTNATSPGGGSIRFTNRNGTNYYLHVDGSGVLRFGTTAPIGSADTTNAAV